MYVIWFLRFAWKVQECIADTFGPAFNAYHDIRWSLGCGDRYHADNSPLDETSRETDCGIRFQIFTNREEQVFSVSTNIVSNSQNGRWRREEFRKSVQTFLRDSSGVLRGSQNVNCCANLENRSKTPICGLPYPPGSLWATLWKRRHSNTPLRVLGFQTP